MTVSSQFSMNSRVPRGVTGSMGLRSQCRSGLSCRRVHGARHSVLRRGVQGSGSQDQARPDPRPNLNETTEQIRDVPEPDVDQSKTQNIAPGNISNENAERRADIGATRPPTLFGTSFSWPLFEHNFQTAAVDFPILSNAVSCRGTIFRWPCSRDHQRATCHAGSHLSFGC